MKLGDKSKTQRQFPNEIYCSSCSELISKDAEICPECGVKVHAAEGVKARQPLRSDEMYCFTCSAVVKKTAEACLSCGVRLAKSPEARPAAHEMYCASCGTIISRNAEVCPKCGVKMPAMAESAKAGKKLTRAADEAYCFSCGTLVKNNALTCVNCGVSLGSFTAVQPSSYARTATAERMKTAPIYGGKSKTMSVLLAIIPLGFWTWLYTYRRDGHKFWFSLLFLGIAGLVATVLTLIDGLPVRGSDFVETFNSAPLSASAIMGATIAAVLVWAWAVADTSSKSVNWYLNYN